MTVYYKFRRAALMSYVSTKLIITLLSKKHRFITLFIILEMKYRKVFHFKGSSFFRANYGTRKKTFNKIIGLDDLQKISEGTLKKSNSKYLLFSDLDIVKTLSELIDTSFPTLNFINPVGIQIIDDSIYKRKKTFTKLRKEKDKNRLHHQ